MDAIPTAAAGISAVRRFNRFYTRQIGVLRQGLLDTPHSLAEARVLYELAHRDKPSASELGQALRLDPGYLSRMLRGFERGGLLRRQPAPDDARRSLLSLTAAGRKAVADLELRSDADAAALLGAVDELQRPRLLQAMATIQSLLEPGTGEPRPWLLRGHRPGDMGWITHRHGLLYAREYGWDDSFEALVADITSAFVRHCDPARERCWLAEREGEILGSVLLVKDSKTVARLRLLLVEPAARGLGIGRRLVEECIRFAREAGYRKLTLWTNDVLVSARRIYEAAGFRLVEEERHHSFGKDLVGQTWELKL